MSNETTKRHYSRTADGVQVTAGDVIRVKDDGDECVLTTFRRATELGDDVWTCRSPKRASVWLPSVDTEFVRYGREAAAPEAPAEAEKSTARASGSLIIQSDKVDALDTALNAAVDRYLPTFIEIITTAEAGDEEAKAARVAVLEDPEASVLAQLALRAFERVALDDLAHAQYFLRQMQAALLMQAEFKMLERDAKGSIIVTG